MKHTITMVALLLPLICTAQEHKKPHRLEIGISTGKGLHSTIKGDSYPWTQWYDVRTNGVHGLSASYYITRHISTGVMLNAYTWYTSSLTRSPSSPTYDWRKGSNGALSADVFANYDVILGRSVVYGGAVGGIAKRYENTNDKGYLYTGNGYEYNVHVGYKLAIIKTWLLAKVEAGMTQTTIRPTIANGAAHYTISSYPLSIGVSVRM